MFEFDPNQSSGMYNPVTHISIKFLRKWLLTEIRASKVNYLSGVKHRHNSRHIYKRVKN